MSLVKKIVTGRLFLAFLMALFALLLRMNRLDWGLPDIYEEGTTVIKAWGFWAWDRNGFDFNPHFFNYPSFYFYLQFVAQFFLRLWGEITGIFPDGDSFRAAYHLRPGLFYLVGRGMTALLGAASVFLLFLTGWRVGRCRVALAGSLFLAMHTVHIHKSRFVEVDVGMVFFVVLSHFFLVRYVQERSGRDMLLAGVAVGLAAAVKYPAALFLVVLFWAELWIQGPFRVSRPLLASLLGGVVFLIATPYVLLDWSSFLRDFGAEQLHMQAGHFGGPGRGVIGAARHFAGGFGPPLAVAVLFGLLAAIFRPRGVERLFWPMPLLLFLLLSLSRMQGAHYPLPAVPSLALLAAVALDRVCSAGGRGRKRLFAPLLAICLVFPAVETVRENARLGSGDTRTRAKVWVEKNLPAGTLLAMEPSGPQLFTSEVRDEYATDPRFSKIRERLLENFAGRPCYAAVTIPSFSIEVNRSERFHTFDPYQWFEYMILSGDVSGRYRSDPDRFPVQNDFYAQVERNYTSIARFETGGGTGSEIVVYRRNAPVIDEGAQIRLDRAGATDGAFLVYMRTIGKLYEGRGLNSPAASIYRAILRIRPDDPETLFYLGFVTGMSGNLERGIALMEASLRVAPEEKQVRMNLGILLCRAGREEEGIDIFRWMLEEDAANFEVHGNLAMVLLNIGDLEGAAHHLRRFLEIAPGHPRAEDIRALLHSL